MLYHVHNFGNKQYQKHPTGLSPRDDLVGDLLFESLCVFFILLFASGLVQSPEGLSVGSFSGNPEPTLNPELRMLVTPTSQNHTLIEEESPVTWAKHASLEFRV